MIVLLDMPWCLQVFKTPKRREAGGCEEHLEGWIEPRARWARQERMSAGGKASQRTEGGWIEDGHSYIFQNVPPVVVLVCQLNEYSWGHPKVCGVRPTKLLQGLISLEVTMFHCVFSKMVKSNE